jgi:hypothetical protein
LNLEFNYSHHKYWVVKAGYGTWMNVSAGQRSPTAFSTTENYLEV